MTHAAQWLTILDADLQQRRANNAAALAAEHARRDAIVASAQTAAIVAEREQRVAASRAIELGKVTPIRRRA